MSTFVTKRSETVQAKFFGFGFSLVQNAFTPLATFEELVEVIRGVPARTHGLTYPAPEEVAAEMKRKATDVLNQLVRERLSGAFVLHFVQSEEMYPVYLEFGYGHDLMALVAASRNAT